MPDSSEYSRGKYASVRFVNPVEKLAFPNADLVRECSSFRGDWAAKSLYLKHKVASQLFPGHFITVEGYNTEVTGFDRALGQDIFTIRLYSRLANIPSEHALYSSHMVKRPYREGGISLECACAECLTHHLFHKQQNLKLRSERLIDAFAKRGFFIDKDDPTDYCLGSTGVIFFEIDSYEKG